MIKKVLWSSMLDYPNYLSTVIFIGNCNWECEYCQNKALINMEDINFDSILSKLLERKTLIKHIVLSGGECTFSKYFDFYIKELKANGFFVGIHTNGENYDEILNNINNIDFIGLDIKTSQNKYNEITNSIVNTENIHKTLYLIITSGIQYDIRTTLFPKFVTLSDLISIAKYLKGMNVANYYIQKYIPLTNEEYNYSNEDIYKFEMELNKIIKTEVRGLI
jgi:pyruvate formate lyase activating enzyme